jgi:uracil-DNA glycosylase
MNTPNVKPRAIIFIGQAPPATPAEIPFGRTRLYHWLESVGLSRDELQARCVFAALVAEFPGHGKHGHMKPTPAQIEIHKPALVTILNRMPDAVIVPVGSMAISEVLGQPAERLADFVGRRFEARPFNVTRLRVIIPLPHPSGGSAWPHLPGNGDRLKQALDLLGSEWRRKASSRHQ